MINQVIVMGRLTRDPELRYTTGGNVPVATFSIAVDRDYKPRDGAERQADFFPVVAWRNQAEFVRNWFAKGQMIAVCGRLQTRKYKDRDGNDRTITEIIADKFSFCGDSRRKEETPPPDDRAPLPTGTDFEEIDDGEVPF